MTLTITWNGGKSALMLAPRLSLLLGFLSLFALGLFTLIILLLGMLGGLFFLLWTIISVFLATPFVGPTLSILLISLLVVLLLFLIGKLLLALGKEYQTSQRRRAGVL